jgi:hypothetical protein
VNDQTLQQHVLSTYNSLRFGMGAIALVTPVVIVLWAWMFHVAWQDSLSAYYFAPSGDKQIYSFYPGRVMFVGILFALGSFLFLYKGFSNRENIALNLAGLFALGVALFPMYAEANYIPSSNLLHFSFAILLFICMAYVAIFCHEDTLQYLPDENLRLRFKKAYYIIGWFMALFPLVGAVLAIVFNAVRSEIYWIEAAGIWAFAAYWFTKSLELKKSQADVKAATGRASAGLAFPTGAESSKSRVDLADSSAPA